MRSYGCITIYRKLVNLLLVTGVLTSCGIEERSLLTGEKLPQRINPRLKPYVLEFMRDMNINVSSTVIIGRSSTLAVCLKQRGDRAQVVVSEDEIDLLSEPVLRAVIYHELAHAELNLNHSAEYDYTLTDPYIYTGESEYYASNWSALVADLKTKANRR